MAEINKTSRLEDLTISLIDAIPDTDTCYSCPVATLRRCRGEEVIAEVLEEVALLPVTTESLEKGMEELKHTSDGLLPFKHRLAARCLLKRAQRKCLSVYPGRENA